MMKNWTWGLGFILILFFMGGCVTPPEVKVALGELDKGYGENIKLMNQYQQLTELIEIRNDLWFEHVQKRVLLDLTLAWITTDYDSNALAVDVSANTLGNDLVQEINKIRLPNLPVRQGQTGGIVFEAGSPDANVDEIILALPKLARLVSKQVSLKSHSGVDLKPTFDHYRTNVTALRRVNTAIKNYLDIDITIAPEDVKDIASAIRTLQQ